MFFLKKEIITIIENKYVAEDCVQIMLPYYKNLSVRDKEKYIFCEYNFYEPVFDETYSGYQNTYDKDPRRYLFPFSNIAVHNEGKYKYANVILDFDRVYIIEVESITYYAKVLRYQDKAIVYENLDRRLVESTNEENINLNKVVKAKEPKIRLFLNKHLTRADLKMAKDFSYYGGLKKKEEEELKDLEKKYSGSEEQTEKIKILELFRKY